MYTYHCTKCDKTFDEIHPYDTHIEWLNGSSVHGENLSQEIQVPHFSDGARMGVKRIDNTFRDVLNKIKAAHPRNTIPHYSTN
jgi:hypothetical protein